MRRLLLLTALLCLLAQTAQAVLPPEVYRERIRNSKVKAIAVVVDVEVLATTDTSVSKKVTFSLERSLGPENPGETFVGHCTSVGKKPPPPGGTLYCKPQKGARVYVTLDLPDGTFTSYTLLTPELEEALLEHPERVRPGMGSVKVEE